MNAPTFCDRRVAPVRVGRACCQQAPHDDVTRAESCRPEPEVAPLQLDGCVQRRDEREQAERVGRRPDPPPVRRRPGSDARSRELHGPLLAIPPPHAARPVVVPASGRSRAWVAEQFVLGCLELSFRDDVPCEQILQVLQCSGGLRVRERMDLSCDRRIIGRRGDDVDDHGRRRRRTKGLLTAMIPSASSAHDDRPSGSLREA